MKVIKVHGMLNDALGLSVKTQDMQDAFYGNLNDIDPRRRPEQRDRSIVNEDHAAPANLPQNGYQIEFDQDKDYKPRYLKQ